MSERFIKLFICDEFHFLLSKHKNAFLLLTLIAARARRVSGKPDGLEIYEAHIGDHEACGLTRQEYRTALNTLTARRQVTIVENCVTRKKSTTESTIKSTTYGTKVKLLNSGIYDINAEYINHRINHQVNQPSTTGQPPPNHEQDSIKKVERKKKEEQDIAQPAPPLRKKDALSFNFETWEFSGINEKDLSNWTKIYPHIVLDIEITKASQWLKGNPSKSRKNLWRKFLTGWFQRANDSIENKKAFKDASRQLSTDRMTKDLHGKVVASIHEGRF